MEQINLTGPTLNLAQVTPTTLAEFGDLIDTAQGDGPRDLHGGALDDPLTANIGDDTLSGGAVLLTSGAANDYLVGGIDADRLNGRADTDTLVCDLGNDTPTGGEGHDAFDCNALHETVSTTHMADVITDVQHGVDDLAPATLDANTATAANDAFTKLLSGDASFTAVGQLKFVGGVLYGNTDSDNSPEFAIHLSGTASVSPGDFILQVAHLKRQVGRDTPAWRLDRCRRGKMPLSQA